MPASRTRAIVALTLLSVCGQAAAQNALGDGRALDNSLNTQGTFNVPNTRNSYAAELRFRNAIVTGNAPGGRSFRGDVGYTAPLDFRGSLGSDSTFGFRRDSLYSGVAGQGIRGTEALQYQFGLTTGATVPQELVGSGIYLRDSNAASRLGPTLSRRSPTDPLADDRGTALWSLRSPAAYVTNRGMRPMMLGTAFIAEEDGVLGQRLVTASPLRGVRLAQTDEDDRPTRSASNAAPRNLADTTGASRAVPTNAVGTAHDTIIERLMQTETDGTTPGEAEWRTRMNDIRETFLQPTDPTIAPEEPEQPDEPEDDERDRSPRTIEFDPETMQMLRGSGEPMSTLVSPDADRRDVFAEHMRAGERLIEQGRYFDAEGRFTRAIAVRPGNVAAMIGRVHAQLGAGMYLSAALNLRNIIIEYPEMAGARYEPELLPRTERLETLFDVLRTNSGVSPSDDRRHRQPGDSLYRESAFLLAYLGYQLGDESATRDGLAALERSVEHELELGATETVDQRVLQFLRQVWLSE